MNLSNVLKVIRSSALEAGKRYSQYCTKNNKVPELQFHYCRDCEAYTQFCMVEEWVWKQIHTPQKSDITLCFNCMEKRLKRRITLKDLKFVPCNEPYFIGFQMDRF